MSEICMVAPTTDAKALGDAGTAVFDARGYSEVVITADALATTEEVDISHASGGTFILSRNDVGAAYVLTATITSIRLAGGLIYGVAKDATASACGVYGAPIKVD